MLEIIMIVGGIFLRLLPHLPNFSSLSATALFAGAYMKQRYAIILSLLAIAISDYLLLYVNPYGSPVINLSQIQPVRAMFHSTTLYVWGSLVVSGVIGLWLRRHTKASNIVLAALATSLQFYLITNLGVWAGGMYSRDAHGLFMSYVMGLPFLRWTLLGDLFYTTVFFGSYALANRAKNCALPASQVATI